jgi:HEAT repeat protein
VSVRKQAISSLMNAPASDSIPLIRTAAKTDPDPGVQRFAAQVLATLHADVTQ